MQLETKYAERIISLLEDAQDAGLPHVVLELRQQDMELQPHHLSLFEKLGDALDYLDRAAGNNYLPGDADYPVEYWHADQLLEEIKQANLLTINKIDMNLNNLENLKEELRTLRFEDRVAAQMEEQMKNGVSEFTLRSMVEGNKGQVDMLLHFKQSNQSDHYYLNKYDVTLNKAKPLAEGEKYLVVFPKEEAGKNSFVKFDVPHEAIAYFKEKKGTSELAIGKIAGKKLETSSTLATMQDDRVNFVAKEFNKVFYAPPVTQTFYVDRGKGFTSEQAANLIQGRAVYRDDMLNVGGQSYQAWVKLDMDRPKDRNGNYVTNQYHVPSYGFDLEKTLDKFNIRELGDPAKKAEIMEALHNGNRPLISTVKDGEPIKLHVEAVPRYSAINFYHENGKPEKREQFELAPVKAAEKVVGKGKEQEAEMTIAR